MHSNKVWWRRMSLEKPFYNQGQILTSKNGLENSKFLGCTLNHPDADHIYLVKHLIKNES